MSDAAALLDRARREPDAAEADRLAVSAIALEPDLGAAYALRGLLAASRGDPVVAAHHFRVAFARGDRAPETRVGLALCLAAAGQEPLAERIRDGLPLPPDLAGFPEAVEAQSVALRHVFGMPLAPRGEPALLPGERLPSRPAPAVAPALEAEETVADAPPPAAPQGQRFTLPPMFTPAPGAGRVVHRTGRSTAAEWVETLAATPRNTVEVETADWLAPLEPGGFEHASGPRFTVDEPLELAVDPGVPEVVARSPVTGRPVHPDDVSRQRRSAALPDLAERPDPLEAAPLFADLAGVERPVVAVRLPGPVMTMPGMEPRKLCRAVAMALTASEVVLRDLDKPQAPPVRLPLPSLARMEVVGAGNQVSLALADGRAIHLDLRGLRARALPAARRVVEALEQLLSS